jgi:hypothetical protein
MIKTRGEYPIFDELVSNTFAAQYEESHADGYTTGEHKLPFFA